jgi:mevalonate kinase
MTKWYVDPTYDPLQDLQDCKTDITMLKGNILQVAAAYNDQSDTIKQLMEQNQKLVKMMIILNDHIDELLTK